MASPYRGGAISGPVHTVRFPRAVRLKWLVRTMYVVLVCGGLSSVWGSVDLDCSRDTGICIVSEHHSLLTFRRELLIADLENVTNDGGIVFQTNAGPVRLSRYSIEESDAMANHFAGIVRRYLGDPRERALYITLQTNLGLLVLGGFSLVTVFVALALTGTKVALARWGTMVRIDEGLRIISVPRVGKKRPREVRLDDVMTVEVAIAKKHPRAPALDDPPVFVALVLTDGKRVPVTEPELANDDVRASCERLKAALSGGVS